MSLNGFQQAIVELTLAPKWFRALRRGELDFLDGYDLNERERRRLRDIALQRGIAMNCSLARGNRLEVIVAAFPKTCLLLKPMLSRLLDELWEQCKPDNYQLFGEEEAFAEFIATKIRQDEFDVEYLDEIFDFEIACRGLRIRVEISDDVETAFETVVLFQHDPGLLLPPLNRRVTPPTGLPVGSFPAFVRVSEDGVEVQPVNQQLP
jgi:hypothetical protein